MTRVTIASKLRLDKQDIMLEGHQCVFRRILAESFSTLKNIDPELERTLLTMLWDDLTFLGINF